MPIVFDANDKLQNRKPHILLSFPIADNRAAIFDLIHGWPKNSDLLTPQLKSLPHQYNLPYHVKQFPVL